MSRPVALERLVVVVVVILTVWGIWSHGLWDPWELDAAAASSAGRLQGVVGGLAAIVGKAGGAEGGVQGPVTGVVVDSAPGGRPQRLLP